jgi:hypothetical protein
MTRLKCRAILRSTTPTEFRKAEHTQVPRLRAIIITTVVVCFGSWYRIRHTLSGRANLVAVPSTRPARSRRRLWLSPQGSTALKHGGGDAIVMNASRCAEPVSVKLFIPRRRPRRILVQPSLPHSNALCAHIPEPWGTQASSGVAGVVTSIAVRLMILWRVVGRFLQTVCERTMRGEPADFATPASRVVSPKSMTGPMYCGYEEASADRVNLR